MCLENSAIQFSMGNSETASIRICLAAAHPCQTEEAQISPQNFTASPAFGYLFLVDFLHCLFMWQTNTSEEQGQWWWGWLVHAGTLDYFLLPTHCSHTLAHEDPQTPSAGRWISTYSPIWAWSHLARKFSSSKLAISVTWACGITGKMQLSQWYISHWECELGAVCMDLKVKYLPSGWKYSVYRGKKKEKGEGKLVRKRRPLILVPARCCTLLLGSLMVVYVDAAF